MNALLVLVVFASCLQVFSDPLQDANVCPQYPSCEECIAHNPCGWCAVPVVYEDGSTGPRCAGKPRDPKNPPPGYRPWYCPIDFQNDKCYGYLCDNSTFQCVSSGAPGRGVPLAQCLKQCFPPTYECNKNTSQCYVVEPGHGTDKPNCEAQCKPSTTSASTGSTTSSGSTTGGPPGPQSAGYTCDTKNLTCVPTSNGGTPKADCDAVCGKPSNNTPIFAVGNYRGLEISTGYIRGEWQARIEQDSAVIVDPSGKVWAKGVVRALNNELWLVTDQGNNRGIYGISDLPEVQVLSWALGGNNNPPPANFDDAMKSGTVFVFAKCISPVNCNFHILDQITRRLTKQPVIESQKRDASQIVINDPCSKYPDCHSCISAVEQCGWCSVDILYNSTIPGKNCAGLNTTITPKINCTGSFTTQDCSFATTGATTALTSTGQSTAGPTPNKYKCDPVNATCAQSPNGDQSKDICDLQCTTVPVVPPILQNTLFRGLQIDQKYVIGEWRAAFTTTGVSVTDPSGKQITGKVSTTERFLTITYNDNAGASHAIQTLWQVGLGPTSQFLSWAWGSIDGPAPDSFDSTMTANSGQTEYWFVSCLPGKDKTYGCDFSH